MKIIAKSLVKSSRNDFYRCLYPWFIKHENFLKERNDKENEKGYFYYKYRNIRAAYVSLKYYINYLFTFEKNTEINIENMINRLEGLFKYQKFQLNEHNGLTKKRKVIFIKVF